MQMNFFDHQDIARRNTRLLIILFTLAVVSLVALTGLLVAMFSGGVALSEEGPQVQTSEFRFHWDIILAACGMVLAAISLAVLYKWAVLRPGGKVIAKQLGGRLVDPGSTDPLDRKVLNVVEEMAIAANMPVPPVYILDQEPGINAFAAGYSPKDAVIGITRGCAQNLTRAQLQGVIAHEIAHILNGDMRLNIRIIAILNGILFISHAGYILLRTGALAGRRNEKNPLPILGLGLLVIGAIGVLFGNIIKAAVSRQREYLADASAVQFTREPEGIGGALQQIGALQQGSKVESKNADESAHLFFGQAISKAMSVFATHPPLQDRIKRILPQWDGEFKANPKEQLQREVQGEARQVEAEQRESMAKRLATLATIIALPEALKEEARNPEGAEALVLALMLSQEKESHDAQMAVIEQRHGPEIRQRIEKDEHAIKDVALEDRLQLVELAMPALKTLDEVEAGYAINSMQRMMHADNKVTLYEWCLYQIAMRYLRAHFRPQQSVSGVGSHKAEDAGVSFKVLSEFGHESVSQAKEAFNAAVKAYNGKVQVPDHCDFERLSKALDRIDHWSVRDKERIVTAWVASVKQDGTVNAVEQKLLFTLCSCIGEPLPELPQSNAQSS